MDVAHLSLLMEGGNTASVSISRSDADVQCLRLREPCTSFPGNQENDEQNLCFVRLNSGGELTSSSSSASPCPKTEGIGETLSPPVQRRWIGELQLIPAGGHLNHPPVRTENLLFPIGKAQLPHPP